MSDNCLRVPITMPADLFSFLEELSLKAKMTGGKKLANAEIVRAAIRFLMESEIDIAGCKNEDEVLERIRVATVKALA